jgi:hypothetical protein
MKFKINNLAGFTVGTVIATALMRTPKGLIRKINDKSCYVGHHIKPTDNHKFEEYAFAIPIWLLNDEERAKIDLNGTHHVTLADEAMCLLAKEDEYAALEVIREITDHHITDIKLKEAKARKQQDGEKQPLFDQYNDLNVFGTLIAVKKVCY